MGNSAKPKKPDHDITLGVGGDEVVLPAAPIEVEVIVIDLVRIDAAVASDVAKGDVGMLVYGDSASVFVEGRRLGDLSSTDCSEARRMGASRATILHIERNPPRARAALS